MKLREIIKLSSDLLNLEDVLNGEKFMMKHMMF